MGFSMDISVPVLAVFLQGLLSFFSPCVLPLLPLYIGYLSGGTARRGEDGRITYERKKVMLHTVFFVLGVSSAFFILGLGGSALGRFFKGNQAMFARIGGIFVAGFGLYQLGIFGPSRLLSREHRLPFSVGTAAMSPVTAFLLGFTFSFAWTPCVGPALASVLLMAASASTQARGFLLIGVYTAGFVLPFLAVGMFSTTLLDVFKRHGNVVTYAARAGAVLMILMGVMMFTGKMNSITGYLSSPQTGAGTVGKEQEKAGETADPGAAGETAGGTGKPGDGPETGETASETGGLEAGETLESAGETVTAEGPEETAGEGSGAGADTLPSVDFTLTDQFGNSHTLSDYKGKTVFLNFWATWCPPCRREMPDIQKLYEKYQAEEDPEVVILGVAAPDYGDEGSREEIAQFLEENGYTYPVVMDEGGELFMTYGVFSYPTTFMIDRDGNVFGYAAGQLSMEMMESIIRQTVTGVREQPGQ